MYFGDLKGVIAASAGALRPNGLLCSRSSTRSEIAPMSTTVSSCTAPLQSCSGLRRAVAHASGLQAKIIKPNCAWRQGRPVLGLVIRAAKSVSADARPPAHPGFYETSGRRHRSLGELRSWGVRFLFGSSQLTDFRIGVQHQRRAVGVVKSLARWGCRQVGLLHRQRAGIQCKSHSP